MYYVTHIVYLHHFNATPLQALGQKCPINILRLMYANTAMNDFGSIFFKDRYMRNKSF